MSICINLPSEFEAQLRREIGDLDQTAKEALLVDLYRRGTITLHELGTTLELGRFQTEELLGRHGVTEDLPSLETILKQADRFELRQVK